MIKREKRAEHLLRILATKRKMTSGEVSDILDISDSSTRRLFLDLEKSGRAIRIIGGIQMVETPQQDYSFDLLEKSHVEEKRQIAELTVQYIELDDTIYFDSGTTLFQTAIALKSRLQKEGKNQLRVITNSYANMQVLDDVCEVILIGGRYRKMRRDFAGFAAEQFLRTFFYNKAFLGTDGFDFSEGFMGSDPETVRLNKIVIKQSDVKYVLLDSSKIGKYSFTRYASLSDIDYMITEKSIDNDDLRFCSQNGLQVVHPEANVILSSAR